MITFSLTRHKLINIALLVLLLIIGGAYIGLYVTSDPKTVDSSQIEIPPSTASNHSTEAKTERKSVPITPEEKNVVAQREYLEPIVEKGQQYLDELNEQEKSLHQKDIEAKKIIEELEQKANATKNQGIAQ